MPQLDPTWFISQIFWLIVMFSILYVLMSKVALPPISNVLEERQRRIEEDIKKAAELKEEAERALRTYEDALAGANKEAKDMISAVKEEMAELAAKKDRELTERLIKKVKESEDKVASAKEDAIKEVQNISEDLVVSMVEKLCGVKVAKEEVKKVVEEVLKEAS